VLSAVRRSPVQRVCDAHGLCTRLSLVAIDIVVTRHPVARVSYLVGSDRTALMAA
jgi:hypothetical protein